MKVKFKSLLTLFLSFGAVVFAQTENSVEFKSIYAGTSVQEIAVSKSGQKFFTVNNDATIRLFDINSYDILDQIEVADIPQLTTIDLDPTFTKALVSGKGGKAKIIDINSKKDLAVMTFGTEDNWSYYVEFNHDGSKAIVSAIDSTIFIYNTSSGKLEKKIKSLPNIWTWAVAYDKDLKNFYFGGGDGKATLYDATSNKYRPINAHTSTVWDAEVSADQKDVLVGDWSNEIRIFELASGYEKVKIVNGSAWVYSVCYSPDGKYIISGDASGVIRTWDANTGAFNSAYSAHTSVVEDMVISPDGKYLFTGGEDGYVKVLDIKNLLIPTEDITSYTDSYDDSGSDENYNPVYDGTYVYSDYAMYGYNGSCEDFDISFDGTKFVTAEENQYCGVYNVSDANYLTASSYVQSGRLAACAISPKGDLAAYGGEDKYITIYNTSNGNTVQTLYGHTDWIYGLDWSNNGKMLVSASTDNSLKLWDPSKGKELKTLSGHTEWIWECQFDPKGKLIVSSASGGQLYLWNTGGKLVKKLEGMTGTIFNTDFSNDGKYIVAGSWDGQIALYDAKGKNLWTSYSTSSTWIYSVAMSPDNKHVLAGDNYGNIFIYDAKTGVLLKTVYAAYKTIYSIKFTKDGSKVGASVADGTVYFYNWNSLLNGN